jgi:hypothetical protein
MGKCTGVPVYPACYPSLIYHCAMVVILSSEFVNKPTARPDSRVGRCSLLAYRPDMSRRCAPSALLSGCSLRFFHSLSVLRLGKVRRRVGRFMRRCKLSSIIADIVRQWLENDS